ncbi:unnamed protein product [Ranitomeya imitator]|uniref:Reverse transcriptase domain-containing protein n=1 Tax=Ranitomeya imitator TaxID=111125 RepID=A0ABN9LK01_9NEOB|nr:unnamed protein product [Ranitomeya imitator]
MAFSMLSYNQDEATSIISQITTPGTFLHTPTEELRTRDFEKDLKRFTALDLHSITLAEYHRVQRIPRGLRVPLRPTLFQDNTEFCGKFEAILNKCSMDLIVLTIDFLQKEITDLKTKISSTEQQLKSTSSPEDFKSLKDKVDKTISDLRDSLQSRKRNKFLRDTEDYKNNQVYRWQSSNYSRNRRFTRRDYSPLSTSSESDFGTTRTSFLEQRQNRQSRGKRGGGSGNVRLKAHFSRIPERVSAVTASSEPIFKLDNLKLRVRSSFQPPRIYHPVETYVDFVKQDVKRVLESIEQGQIHVKQNLTRDEHLALVSLKNNRQLIIKPADKGGSIVVLDRDYYMQEIRTQLSDLGTYRLVSSNPTFDIARVIKGFIDHHLQEGSIDEKLGDYLFNQHPVLPVFYTLPKIHKHSTRPPGRPIVASTNSLLSPLAITLEKILSPLVPRIKSFLKDTSQFLESLQNVGPLPEDCLLVTMDVNSLYTSIGHQDGIKAVMSFLEEHTQFSSQQKSFCRDLLTLILTKKIFIFEDQFFLQERGTAMGSNMAPPYANIFMDQFEITFVYSHPSFISFASYWRRYIDDIFLIWTGDSETLEAFHDDLNSSLEGLTFSISSSTSSMNFLDTLFSVSSDRVLETDLYVKPTDRNSLLKFVSCHPKHIKVSLPRSQHARIDRIVSKPDVCRMRHHEMDSKFRTRGYPTHVLDTQQRIIRTREKHNVPRIAFVSTYHPFNHLINSCVTRHWDILGKAYPQVEEFLIKPIISNKRCPNLRDCLIRADVGSSVREISQRVFSTPRNGTFPCLSCHQCSNITKGDSFTHPRSGKKFPIKGHFTCNSSFVIYLIKCPCGLGYVGETTQHIRDRISQHKSTIRCGKTLLPVPAHFAQNNHTVAQLSIQEGIPARTPLGRRMRSSIFDFGSVRRHSAFPNCTLLTYAPPLKWEFHPYTKADK